MGGGDLNLKKSWHPNTMKNMERVWKAEQKDNEEKKRIAELQREINAERDKEDMQKFAEDTGVLKKKDDVKLEWMYKGPSHSVNHEDYLLGKSIDKNFEKHQEQQRGGASATQDEERVPDALRQAKSSVFSEQVDVARKMNEDPLMAIRQRAVEKAKQLYDNPVRLKQLQKMIASKSMDEKKNKKDKKKKKKKSKKSSKKEEDKELNALLTEKLKSALKDRELLRKLKKKASKSSDSSSIDSNSDESDEEDTSKQRRKESPNNIDRLRSHSPKYSKDNRRKDYSSSHHVQRDGRRQSQSPKPNKFRSFNDKSTSSRRRSRSRSKDCDNHKHFKASRKRNSRSRSRERQNFHNQREHDQSRNSEMKYARNTRRSSSTEARKSRKQYTNPRRSRSPESRRTRKQYPEKRKNKDRSPSSDNDFKGDMDKGKRNSSSSSTSDHQIDSDDDHRAKKKRSFGLIMADGSRPVPKPNLQREAKPVVQQQKPNAATWQRKERVKLSEEEKERRRQEMLQNASWRDKEREENVKRYRKEDDREKQQLHENFDEDFARKQFSKAANQTSVEGRIKSKLNTIQRSKMSMDQNFARR